MHRVSVGEQLAARISERWGPQRSGRGKPSEYDFWSGPLAAALLAFRDFESLPFDPVPAVRTLVVFDRIFGAIAFVGVLVGEHQVELVAAEPDPDYWELIADDPE
jgi:hypothetical protein